MSGAHEEVRRLSCLINNLYHSARARHTFDESVDLAGVLETFFFFFDENNRGASSAETVGSLATSVSLLVLTVVLSRLARGGITFEILTSEGQYNYYAKALGLSSVLHVTSKFINASPKSRNLRIIQKKTAMFFLKIVQKLADTIFIFTCAVLFLPRGACKRNRAVTRQTHF